MFEGLGSGVWVFFLEGYFAQLNDQVKKNKIYIVGLHCEKIDLKSFTNCVFIKTKLLCAIDF